MGCSLQAEKSGDELVVTGARCKRGRQYAQDEMINPRRIVTTTLIIRNGEIRRLPVRTSKPFPLSRIHELIEYLSTVEVEAPIQSGQIIAANCLGEGIDLIATRTVSARLTQLVR
jgi:CxxC motif-containing protein